MCIPVQLVVRITPRYLTSVLKASWVPFKVVGLRSCFLLLVNGIITVLLGFIVNPSCVFRPVLMITPAHFGLRIAPFSGFIVFFLIEHTRFVGAIQLRVPISYPESDLFAV